jgi:CheY-like chemotaxis protein
MESIASSLSPSCSRMARSMTSVSALRGRHVLIVEDDYLIANDLEHVLSSLGARIVGPAATCDRALALVEASAQLDAAVLDLNLRGSLAFPIADALRSRGVPFVFATGYDQLVVPDTYANVPRCQKPIDSTELSQMLASRMPGETH